MSSCDGWIGTFRYRKASEWVRMTQSQMKCLPGEFKLMR
jgi:hypothetical protein